MAVIDLVHVEDVDNAPDKESYSGYWGQGTTWVNYSIYKLVSDDGTEQFFRIGKKMDSYGDEQSTTPPELVVPTTKTIQVWSKK